MSLAGPHLQSAGPVPGAAGPALGWTGQSRNRSSQSNGVNILRQEVPAMQKKAKMMETATWKRAVTMKRAQKRCRRAPTLGSKCLSKQEPELPRMPGLGPGKQEMSRGWGAAENQGGHCPGHRASTKPALCPAWSCGRRRHTGGYHCCGLGKFQAHVL